MENLLAPGAAAIFLARALLGILFLIQGFDKVFSIGIKSVVQTIEPSYRRIKLPSFFIYSAAVFTSYTELIGGILLIAGLFKYVTLYLLGIDLLIVAIGLSLVDPVWKMDIVFPRFVLLIFILIVPSHVDCMALDNFF